MEGRSMLALILGLTARIYYALRRFMPTNLVLDAIHTRRGLKWGVPTMLLAVPYCFAMLACVGLAETGGSGWLNVLALLFAWNALKFLVAGPVTLVQLHRVRGREGQARHRASRRRAIQRAAVRVGARLSRRLCAGETVESARPLAFAAHRRADED
jgi:hypothetical protein